MDKKNNIDIIEKNDQSIIDNSLTIDINPKISDKNASLVDINENNSTSYETKEEVDLEFSTNIDIIGPNNHMVELKDDEIDIIIKTDEAKVK